MEETFNAILCHITAWLFCFSILSQCWAVHQIWKVKKTLYSFKTYLETVIQEGAQERVEEDELKRGQGPYSHTRKKAVSMTAKLMVSNDPNLRKVRAINFPDINIDPVINRQTTWVSCILGKLPSNSPYARPTLGPPLPTSLFRFFFLAWLIICDTIALPSL